MSNNHHIPPEVVTEILCRVSPWDARKFRCVSKQWLAIIDNPEFIQRQLQRSTALFFLLQAESESESESVQNLYRVEPSSLAPTTPSLIRKPYDISHRHQRSILVGSCRGLLCFCTCGINECQLFVLNPATQETGIFFRLWDWVGPTTGWAGYGFGYDQSSGDYKAVFFLRKFSLDGGVGDFVAARIRGTTGSCHTLSSSKTYGHNTYVPLGHQKMGVHLGGSLHWFAVTWEYYRRRGHDDQMPPPNCVLLIALDLRPSSRIDIGSEYKIRELGQPDYGRDDGPSCEKTVGVLDSCLCVCASYGVVDIWVMKEYGEHESWYRLYPMVINDPVLTGVGFVLPLGKFRGDSGQILMLVDGNRLVWYDPLKQSAKLVPVSGLENYGALGLKLEALGCLEIPCKSFVDRE